MAWHWTDNKPLTNLMVMKVNRHYCLSSKQQSKQFCGLGNDYKAIKHCLTNRQQLKQICGIRCNYKATHLIWAQFFIIICVDLLEYILRGSAFFDLQKFNFEV